MPVYVGIAVAKATLDVGVVRAATRVYGQFANSRAGFGKLHRFLRRHTAQQGWVCLEATGYRVSVVNPAAVRGYAQTRLSRNTTDKVDAYWLAEFCRNLQPPRWTPPPAEWRERPALVRHYQDLSQALYMPALVALRFNPVARAFAHRLLANGLPKKAVSVAVMRKLLHLVYRVLKSQRPFDPL